MRVFKIYIKEIRHVNRLYGSVVICIKCEAIVYIALNQNILNDF